MDPELIVFAIRAILRLGRAGTLAANQYARDRKILLPKLQALPFTEDDFIQTTLRTRAEARLKDANDLGRFWKGVGPLPDNPDREVLRLAAVQIEAELTAHNAGQLPVAGAEMAGQDLIEQWSKSSEPVPPWARLALTMADIALEFFAADPSVLGIGGNGEKLIGAFAGNLAELIPDDPEEFGLKRQFADRLLGIVLRAGLETLSEQPGLVLHQENLQQLVRETLPPLIAALPDDLAKQSQWHDVMEALLGPAAQAALKALAANPRAYFGREFDSGQALGGVTQALLKQVSETGLRDQFTDAGIIKLLGSVANVAAERPELFLGRVDSPAEKIAADLFGDVAQTLKNASPPFDTDLGIDFVVSALETLQADAPGLLDPSKRWEALAGAAAKQVIQGLEDGFKAKGMKGLPELLSQKQLLALGKIFLTQVAHTPQMLVGDRLELQAIVHGFAAAMADDADLLLAPNDWLQIAAEAATQAAANPGRLFKLDPSKPGEALATVLIRGLLGVAAAELKSGGRDAGGVLFGATLRQAILMTLRVAAGNSKAAEQNVQVLVQVAKQLSDLVRSDPGRFGSKEFLLIYRTVVSKALGEGAVQLTEPFIKQILAGGVEG